MATQQLIVFALVLACSLYAMWVLMPAATRRLVAKGLAQLPLGRLLKGFFQKASAASAGCDCSSNCDKVVDRQRKAPTQVVRFQPRIKP